MDKRHLKPYVAVLLIVLYGLNIFWLSGYIVAWTGELGMLLYEALLALTAVLVTLLFRVRLREVFPFRRPRMAQVFGTLLFWAGCFLTAMIPSVILMYVFPSQMMEAGQGVSDVIGGVPFLLGFLLICITPAVCEEAAFRGGLYSCFRRWGKWPAILLTAAVFGAFHGSLWRFVPTAILGIGMGYLLAETGNMFYNMLFHLVNNLLPLVLLQAISLFSEGMGDSLQPQLEAAMGSTQVPLATVAVYFIWGSAAPFLLYAGSYLIHKGQPGWQDGFLPRRKNLLLLGMLLAGGMLFLLGILLFMVSLFVDRRLLMGI